MGNRAPGGFVPRGKRQTLKQRLAELPSLLREQIHIWTPEEIRRKYPGRVYPEQDNIQAKRPAGWVRQL